MKENSKGVIKKNSDGTYRIIDLDGNEYKVHYKIGETEYTNEFMKNLNWGDIQDIISMYHIEFINYDVIEEENKYVDNDVFRFRVSLKRGFEELEFPIYTKPFPKDNILSDDECDKKNRREEELVKEKYFTQQCIDELKFKLIQKIQESKNPFNIYCVDRDGGYNVTKKQLFNLE